MNLPPEQFAACLGHCTSMASGTRAAFGTDTKTLHMGRGAQNGILAATLASQGFGSSPSAIEAWAKLVSSTVNVEKIGALARCGEWQILQNTFKPYPCGIVIHPLIDGCLEARRSLNFIEQLCDPDGVAEGIKEVEVLVNPQCIRLCNVRDPKSGLETIFSLYHACAVALVHGRAGLAEFSDEVATDDPAVRAVRDKIKAIPSDGIGDAEATLTFRLWGKDSDMPGTPPTLTTQDRSYWGVVEHVEHVTNAIGSLENPMSDEMLEEKFTGQAKRCIGKDKARAAIKGCWELDKFVNVGGFVWLFVPG
jgi:aconitate decarboxylase